MDTIQKGINFKVPEELWRDAKIEATKQNLSLKDYIIGLIQKDLKEKGEKNV